MSITPYAGVLLDNTAQVFVSWTTIQLKDAATGNGHFSYYTIEDYTPSEVDYEATLTSEAAVKNDKRFNPNEYTTTGTTGADWESRLDQI
ncbi:hypothetical protein DYB37_007714 [Aphanomyces astaci]|nr:hypothetical protein DYB25_008602 [Aphanomyces astaci]RHY18686.1 hypothetical protein DYB36_012279 [Aphanomyces astaci]RHY36076.1 hypothetical protein DYB38_009384 [Aphanomyces astaci]RHY63693.1 hypothetical protein DYB30_011810 [Aphanomyces astaci]RHY68928.1 hypothetical protein DYB34_004611 [Aphanomyces astaci]